LSVSLSYNGDSQMTQLNRYEDAAGTESVGSTTYGYDAQGNMTSLVDYNNLGESINSYVYTYDAGAQLTAEVDDGSTTDYGYDGSGQLTSAGTSSYGYDANGNPTGPGYSIGTGNELLTDPTWKYQYDANGNLIGKTGITNGMTWTYTYDVANRLIGAVEVNSQGQTQVSASYTFDVFGNRNGSTVMVVNSGTVVTRYAFDGNTMWAQLDSSNNLQMRYIAGAQADQYFARVDAYNTVGWYLTDHLGSVRAILSNGDQEVSQIDYNAYGQVIFVSNQNEAGSILYGGYFYDWPLGVYNVGRRPYDPYMDRFLIPDPTGLKADTNTYRYVDNAPTDATDPSGEYLVTRSVLGKDIWVNKFKAAPYNLKGVQWYGIGRNLWYIYIPPSETAQLDEGLRSDPDRDRAAKIKEAVKWGAAKILYMSTLGFDTVNWVVTP
jgi:RHS repeat-associated protein